MMPRGWSDDAQTSSRGTMAEDAGRKRAQTQAKDTSAPDGSNVTVPLLGTLHIVVNRNLGTKVNESVLAPTVMDEGQPRANESGPLTILQPLSHGRRCDASMPTRAQVPHSASTSSEHEGPTEPTPLSECVISTFAEIIAREHANKES